MHETTGFRFDDVEPNVAQLRIEAMSRTLTLVGEKLRVAG